MSTSDKQPHRHAARGRGEVDERPRRDPPAVEDAAVDAALDLDGAEALLGDLDGDGGDSAASGQELSTLMDDAFGEGRRLARLGDCSLIVAHDGLTAWLRGPPPGDATYDDLVALLREAGITFGVVSGRLHEALPRRRSPGRERPRRRDTGGADTSIRDIEVARGQAPVPPVDTRIEYTFPVPEDGAFERFAEVLTAGSLSTVRQAAPALPLVASGAVLARVRKKAGRNGRNVFGQAVPPPLPPEAQLQAGDFVRMADDGESCRAEICGYAGLQGGVLAILPPVWVARDLLTACFVYRPTQDRPPTPAETDIRAVLGVLDISYGLQEEAIEQLAADLAAGKPVETCTLLARGLEAEESTRTVWDFCFHPDLTRYFTEINRILTAGRRVDYLVSYSKGLAGKPVNAGEHIAEKKPGQEGVMGRDVYGEEFMPPEASETHLEAGDHVSFVNDGGLCIAGIYGYLGIDEELLTIVPAIWVTPDLTIAYFVNLTQLGEPHAPSPEEIDQLLQHAGVKFGIDHRAIGILCEKLLQKIPCEVAEPIARAQLPRPGVDGPFEFAVDIEPRPGLFRDDGSVDFRALNLAPLLQANDLLGVLAPPTPGAPGTDLQGRALAARDGTGTLVDTGKNVRAVTGRDDITWFQADIDGELVYKDRRDRQPPRVSLAVHSTMVIQGDVDYTTGSIDYPGSVEVRGSVQSGFTVKAEGNITVGDTLEDGAVLEAGASIAVAHGIIGSKTRITSGDAVYAKFVQEAHVRAGGDVVVSEYLRDATVHSGAEVVVAGRPGNSRSGAILGGLTVAASRIRAKHIGAEGSKPTNLVGGVDPALLQRAARLQKIADQGEAIVGKALKSLSLDKVDRRQLKSTLLGLILRTKGPRRQVLVQSVKKLLQLQAQSDKAAAERAAILGQLEELASRARIAVEGTVAVNTVVRIGDRTRTVREEGAEITGVVFTLVKGKNSKTELRMVAG